LHYLHLHFSSKGWALRHFSTLSNTVTTRLSPYIH